MPPVEGVGGAVPFDRGYGAEVSSGAAELGEPLALTLPVGPVLPVGNTVLLLELVRVSG